MKTIENGFQILSHGGIGNKEKDCNLTGSCHELRVILNGEIFRILVDMGGYQGPGKLERNLENILDGDGTPVNAVVFSHGHMDHIGDSLILTKNSVGEIITSPETKKIMEIALTDAVKIEQTEYDIKKNNFQALLKKVKEAVKIVKNYEKGGIKRNSSGDRVLTNDQEHNKKEIYQQALQILQKEGIDHKDKNWQKKFVAPKQPEYTEADVGRLIEQVETVSFQDGWTDIIPGKVTVCMFNAGHILGSTSPLFRIMDKDNNPHYIHFSGDIGSFKGGIAPSGLPTPPTNYPIEAVVIESTYGGRVRDDFEKTLDEYEQGLKEDVRKYDTIVQACFSLDRLQKILFYTIDAQEKGIIPRNIPIFVDSKMGTQYIDPYIRSAIKQLKESENPENKEQLQTKTDDLEKFIKYLQPGSGKYEILDKDNRDLILNGLEGKKIIITASGMADGGPIMGYLERYAQSPRAVFYYPGFLVPGTTGAHLANENRKKIKLNGNEIVVQAKMVQKNGFSGHGDEKDLLQYLESMNLKRNADILVVHGDTQSSSLALAHTLKRKGFPQNVIVPELSDIHTVDFDK